MVTDHHAIVPTVSAGTADVSVLPTGEREILRLVSRQLLCAVSDPFLYEETVVTLDCGGYEFTVKGKTVLTNGWKAYVEQEQNGLFRYDRSPKFSEEIYRRIRETNQMTAAIEKGEND